MSCSEPKSNIKCPKNAFMKIIEIAIIGMMT